MSNNVFITAPDEVVVYIDPPEVVEVQVEPAEQPIEVVIEPGSVTYRPIRTTRRGFIAAENLSALRIVALNFDNTVSYASSSNLDQANRVKGLTVGSALDGESVEIIEEGPYTDESWDWGTNQAVFLRENGTLSIIPPTEGFYMQVAQSETSDTLYINIQTPILL